jgi:hypothetical protein
VALSNGSAVYSTSALTHGTHTVSASYPGDGNFTGSSDSLIPGQTVNTTPFAGGETIERYPTQGVKVRLATLLANDGDADSDPLTVTIPITSANDGIISSSGDWVIYTPAEGFTGEDSFAYTLEDDYGGSISPPP